MQIYEFDKQIKEIDTAVKEYTKKTKIGFSFIIGLIFWGVTIFFSISIFKNYSFDRFTIIVISIFLSMCFILGIVVFFDSKLAITIASSATAPFLAFILIYLQYQGSTYDDMINGLALPIIFVTFIHGILHFIAELQYWIIDKYTTRKKKEIIQPIKTRKELDELIQLDLGRPGTLEKIMYDKEVQKQLLYAAIRMIEIYEKYDMIDLGDIDLEELKNSLKNY